MDLWFKRNKINCRNLIYTVPSRWKRRLLINLLHKHQKIILLNLENSNNQATVHNLHLWIKHKCFTFLYNLNTKYILSNTIVLCFLSINICVLNDGINAYIYIKIMCMREILGWNIDCRLFWIVLCFILDIDPFVCVFRTDEWERMFLSY